MSKNRERVMPDIFNNIISPPANIPLLEFYKGYYDCVFIMLHPFYKITHPNKIDFEMVWPTKQRWLTKKEIISFTENLSWADFIKLSGIPDNARLDIALRNSIAGLNKKHLNQEELDLLNDTCDKYKLIQPQKGDFSDSLIDNMLKTLLQLGHEWIFIGDEFGHERKLHFIEDIVDNTIEVNYHYENWYTPKNEILYTTHWDSHFTMICSDKKTVEEIVKLYPFEGFYCDQNTHIYWSLS
jgi:hypothetical protein